MDILSDILQSADIQKTLLIQRSFYEPWAMAFPCDRSMGFHVITQGEAWLRSPRLKQPIALKKGDLILLTRGFNHELATDLDVAVKSTAQVDDITLNQEGLKPLVTLASGVYFIANQLTHPLFDELPETILLKSEEIAAHSPLQAALLLLSLELTQGDLGSEAITRNLLDILFHYILRNWIHSINDKNCRWNMAFRDSHLMRALKVIHETPHKNWPVEQLASVSGLSRAVFSQKFKQLTGDTPAHYLTSIRIQKAAKVLRQGRHNIEQVAELMGYPDAFVFSKVFKRLLGQSPRDYKNSYREGVYSMDG
ncbi:AraC family transcriptional regulator [Undibacterium danionis]|uniref:Cupin domain-containing protein n=1 Tax=Undibacterium danionis TaxID=1812100 RepID=A0ABV6IFN3_9BURK